jgi:hypothetical protein
MNLYKAKEITFLQTSLFRIKSCLGLNANTNRPRKLSLFNLDFVMEVWFLAVKYFNTAEVLSKRKCQGVRQKGPRARLLGKQSNVSATEGFTVSQQKFIHSLHLFHLYFISIV